MFECSLEDPLRCLFPFLAALSDSVSLFITADGIRFQSTDGHEALADVFIPPAKMAFWKYKKDASLEVSAGLWGRALGHINNQCPIEISQGDHFIEVSKGDHSFTLPTRTPRETQLIIPEFNHVAVMRMPTRMFLERLRFLQEFGESVNVSVGEGTASLSATQDQSEGYVELLQDNEVSVKSRADYEGLFPLTPLLIIEHFSPQIISLSVSKEKPLDASFSIGGLLVRVLVSPIS